MFFPQLVAGPIERPQNLLHQFYEKHRVRLRRTSERALKRMAWGLFMKVVIADRLARYVNRVYNESEGVRATHAGHRDRFFRLPDLLRFRRLLAHRDRRGAKSWDSS